MELNTILQEHPAKWMIWEGSVMQHSADRLKAIGLGSLVFNPCGNKPHQGDFLRVVGQNVENLKSAFQKSAASASTYLMLRSLLPGEGHGPELTVEMLKIVLDLKRELHENWTWV